MFSFSSSFFAWKANLHNKSACQHQGHLSCQLITQSLTLTHGSNLSAVFSTQHEVDNKILPSCVVKMFLVRSLSSSAKLCLISWPTIFEVEVHRSAFLGMGPKARFKVPEIFGCKSIFHNRDHTSVLSKCAAV